MMSTVLNKTNQITYKQIETQMAPGKNLKRYLSGQKG